MVTIRAACAVTELSALDLAKEMAANPDGAQAYRVWLEGEATPVQVLAYSSEGRYGVAWGADAEWTDADCIDQAVQRVLSGEAVS